MARTSPTCTETSGGGARDDGTNTIYSFNGIDQFGIRNSDGQVLSKAGYEVDQSL